jgi:hypothetical protein
MGETFLMPSWTIEEYTEALQNHEFRNLVESNLGEGTDLDEKIMNKYFLAGGSARWMFDFSPEIVLRYNEINLNPQPQFQRMDF